MLNTFLEVMDFVNMHTSTVKKNIKEAVSVP